MCAKCKRRVESLEAAMMDLAKFKRSSSYAAIITCHYSILTSILYRVRTLTSRNVEESENSPESPHLGEIKRMRKQCVPGTPPFFAHARDQARKKHALTSELHLLTRVYGIWTLHVHFTQKKGESGCSSELAKAVSCAVSIEKGQSCWRRSHYKPCTKIDKCFCAYLCGYQRPFLVNRLTPFYVWKNDTVMSEKYVRKVSQQGSVS